MGTVFNILDEDGSGDVAYKEFVEQLHKMKASDSHTMLVFIKHFVTELRKRVCTELAFMNKDIAEELKSLQAKSEKTWELLREDLAVHQKGLDAIEKRLGGCGIQPNNRVF